MASINNTAYFDVDGNVIGTGLFYVGYNYALLLPCGIPQEYAMPPSLAEYEQVMRPGHCETDYLKVVDNYSVRVRVFQRDGYGDSKQPWRDITHTITNGRQDDVYISAAQLPDAMRLVREGLIHALIECVKFGG